jgi:hypothetical protein
VDKYIYIYIYINNYVLENCELEFLTKQSWKKED